MTTTQPLYGKSGNQVHLMGSQMPETILSYCCRQKLSEDLKISPERFVYIGTQNGKRGKLVMFNIFDRGHELNGSTRSVWMPE